MILVDIQRMGTVDAEEGFGLGGSTEQCSPSAMACPPKPSKHRGIRHLASDMKKTFLKKGRNSSQAEGCSPETGGVSTDSKNGGGNGPVATSKKKGRS